MIKRIDAKYTERISFVGDFLDINKIKVHADFTNGERHEILEGFSVYPSYIYQFGRNTFKVCFSNKVAYFDVTGTEYPDKNSYDNSDRYFDNKSVFIKRIATVEEPEAVESGKYINKSDIIVYKKYYERYWSGRRRVKELERINDRDYNISKNYPLFRGLELETGNNGNGSQWSSYCPYSGITIQAGRIFYPNNYISTKPKFLGMLTWYEGFPVLNTYDQNDIIVYMYTDAKEWIQCYDAYPGIKFSKYDENSKRIIVKVTYKEKIHDDYLESYVYIPKLTEEPEPEHDFSVEYMYDDAHGEDVTSYFKYGLEINDTLYITWNKFIIAANNTHRFGKFVLIAPRRTGLDSRYDTRWDVEYDGKNLKACLIEQYKNQ